MPRPSSGDVLRVDQAGLLQPGDRVGHPAAAVGERVGELGHPHLPSLALGEPDQDLVLRQREAELAAQVVVEPVDEQGHPHHQRAPRALLVVVEPLGRRLGLHHGVSTSVAAAPESAPNPSRREDGRA